MKTNYILYIVMFILAITAGFIFFSSQNNQAGILEKISVNPSQDTANVTEQSNNAETNEVSGLETTSEISSHVVAEAQADAPREEGFSRQRLSTNTALRSIELSEVLSGGPGKDGIPAINDPVFYSVSEAQKVEDDDIEGLLVTVAGETKFYPYSVLVWHEIVNDTVGDVPVSVTFCPLCGTGIVFDRRVGGEILQFGVSGMLWQSNLLMYDTKTESLWSQAIGRAVVGDLLDTQLGIVNSDVITFATFKENFPNGQVLSRETGHIRLYDHYPYGNYESNDDLYFPVKVQDERHFSKELMYVVPVGDQSVAFVKADLINAGSATVQTDLGAITAQFDTGLITVTNPQGTSLPGYHEMWFSWATHHQDDGIVWSK